MHLTLCAKRNRKNFKNFRKWQKTPARFWRTNVSYKRFIQVFYTTVCVQNLSRYIESGYSKNAYLKDGVFRPQMRSKRSDADL
jgi:hypothetical protein